MIMLVNVALYFQRRYFHDDPRLTTFPAST
jgi:hypothetical protein